MPNRPLHECNHPGCHVLVQGKGNCQKHRRASSTKRGYGGKRWLAFRKVQLEREPLCRECLREGRTVAATDVDHVTPIEGPADPRFYDLECVQSLCHSCHARKTAQESGFSRRGEA